MKSVPMRGSAGSTPMTEAMSDKARVIRYRALVVTQ